MEKIEQEIMRIDELKSNNKEYIYELQKLFDIVDNVLSEELKMDIINQMLKCENILSKIMENEIKK